MDQKSRLTPSLATAAAAAPPIIQPLMMHPLTPPGGSAKTSTPDRLTLPKAFKYAEMYKSPTDEIMSPISKGLLSRTRFTKSSSLLPHRNPHHKIQPSKFQDLGALKT